MKSTYRLLSIYLDNKPILQTSKPIENATCCALPDITEEYSLFDYPICRRKISGKFLLSSNDFSEIESHIEKIPACQELFIMLDQEPISSMVGQLFAKRVLQAAKLIKDRFPDIALTIAANPENIDVYRFIVDRL